MIYLGADHGGFELKEKLKAFLEEEGYDFEDLGAFAFDPADDYPDFGAAVAAKVAEDPKNNRGVLLCRTGIGMNFVADKFKGVRCAVVWTDDEALVKATREHNDTNVISLPGDYLTEEQAKKIVKIWLETPFSGEERHVRRLNKIKEIEGQTR